MTDAQTGVSPYLYYVDGIAAMEFLANVFGFREHTRMVEDDGTLRHGEMRLGDAAVMLGCPPGIRTPKELGQVTVGVYIRVPDVDAHYARCGRGRGGGRRTAPGPAVPRAALRRGRSRRPPVVVRNAACMSRSAGHRSSVTRTQRVPR